ncbi:MAG: glutamate-5-semialdehyde dehydrogenase [Acidimicrobiales bacterium]
MPELAARAKVASRVLAVASTAVKDDALHAADLLVAHADEIVGANRLDVARAEEEGMAAPLVDRLRLDARRIEAMAGGLRQVASLPDPVGQVTEGWVRPNGLRIERVRCRWVWSASSTRAARTSPATPSGCASSRATRPSCGVRPRRSTRTWRSRPCCATLAKAGLPEDALLVVDDVRREAAVEFMQQRGFIDCLIPRGGPALIQSILDNATVPYVIDGAKNCHVYVDAAADLDMAREIVHNAKTQRPGVCNAAESLVVHAAVAPRFLPAVVDALEGVELVGDDAARAIVPEIGVAAAADFATEFLDLKLSVKVVADLDEAIAHVNDTSTGHSEAIITNDLAAADRFTREVDAAAVLVNASTRFVDGEEFGFGAEIGISTQKLHARGPMGLEQLTTGKFVVRGNGQTWAETGYGTGVNGR